MPKMMKHLKIAPFLTYELWYHAGCRRGVTKCDTFCAYEYETQTQL